jgi:hypothetical protein
MSRKDDIGRGEISRTPDKRLANTGKEAGSIIDKALSRLSAEQHDALMAKAAEEALRLEVARREQDQDQDNARRVVQDHIDTVNLLNKDGRLTRHSVSTDVKTGAGRMQVSSKTGPTCFVATAAYGNPDHPEVVVLRRFRDDVLQHNVYGRAFIRAYWIVGPVVARVVMPFPVLRAGARLVIRPVVQIARRNLSQHSDLRSDH